MSLEGAAPYQGWRETSVRQRAIAAVLVVGLHLAVIGGFVIASLRNAPPPPERVLEVSFIRSAPATPSSSSPPQPTQQQPPPPTPAPVVRPQPTLLATQAPTPSPMSAPPVERRTVEAPVAAAPSPPQPAAPAAAAAATAPAAATPGPITPPSFTAAYLNNPGPVYPPASRRKREEGTVHMRVQVSPEGAPLQVVLDRSSGFAELDAAAMDVVRKRWRFAPAQQSGRAIAAWVRVPLEFSITR